jgi:hypothetical protein
LVLLLIEILGERDDATLGLAGPRRRDESRRHLLELVCWRDMLSQSNRNSVSKYLATSGCLMHRLADEWSRAQSSMS